MTAHGHLSSLNGREEHHAITIAVQAQLAKLDIELSHASMMSLPLGSRKALIARTLTAPSEFDPMRVRACRHAVSRFFGYREMETGDRISGVTS
jgi:hypothetical protein